MSDEVVPNELRDELPNDMPDDGPNAEPAEPRPVTRRAALRVLGAVPFVGAAFAAGAQQPVTGTPAQPRQPHTTPNQPAQGGNQPARNTAKRHFFTAKEWRTVGVLADDVIPRDARSPSASEVGVPQFLDFNLSVPETDDATRVGMRGGLRWMDTESRKRFGVAYAAASTVQRHAILDDIAWPERARSEFSQGVAFFSRFRDLCASGFFSTAAGWKDLRYAGNVFNPGWNGCPQPALDKLKVSYDMMKSRVPVQAQTPSAGRFSTTTTTSGTR